MFDFENKNYVIDEILGDFGFYKDPQLLKEEFQKMIDPKATNITGTEKYTGLLSNINYAWRKTLKYGHYFEKFYTADNSVENFEALNHHIHAYLQDMDTLKNKIKLLLDNLKKDVGNIASNREDVVAFVEAGVAKNYEVFDGILKYRIQHVHNGSRFIDGDLLKAEIAHFSIKAFDTPAFNSFINPERKPELMAKFEQNKKESFDVAKQRWVKNAQNNAVQTTGWVDSLLKIIRPNLYQFLNIKSVKSLIDSSTKKND